MRLSIIITAIAVFAGAGCGTEHDPDGPVCTGAKCDVPDDPADTSCDLRRADAFNENQLAYTPNALRWSCADVEGVTGEDRGQEYCEYFAIVQLPAEEEAGAVPEPAVLGRNLGEDYSFGTTPLSVELTANQISELEYGMEEVVGQCVFTSWQTDLYEPIPACDDKTGCPDVMGVRVGAEDFQMKFEVNSADAAQMLVEDCLVYGDGGDPDNADDPLHDDFYRGCMLNAKINETEYRKSDSTICAASIRLAECECWPREGDDDFPVLIAPMSGRGFPLGTWSDAGGLPKDCQYVNLGDLSKNIVVCDLTAADVLTYAGDPKGRCREKYADNVVVHVPIPADAIVCSPADSASYYSGTCNDTPWVLEEGGSGY